MKLKELVDKIYMFAAVEPNVHQIVDNFEELNEEDTQYAAIVLQQREHDISNGVYNFYLGYVDRLTTDESNKLDIYTAGIDAIKNISMKLYSDEGICDISIGRTIPLKNKFSADAAIVYSELSVTIPTDTCTYEY